MVMADRTRRRLLGATLAGAALLPLAGRAAAEAVAVPPTTPAAPLRPVPSLAPIDAAPDRIIAMNVCTRPFRDTGPRIERERIRRREVVHNYGHGGSGWSLSWGSAAAALELVRQTGAERIAVIGCGAIGLTTAILAQRAGLAVTIYARERPPVVRSSYATGVWSPESRICTAEHGAAFGPRWARMARFSHRRFQTLLGLPGDPVEYRDIYQLADEPFGGERHGEPGEPEYPRFVRTLAPELSPRAVDLAPGSHPFPVAHARRSPLMMFNIGAYSRLLLDDFHQAGGEIVTAEFEGPEDFANLDERTIVNCTGYGARALLGDESVRPVRGQTAKLIPQPEVDYGIRYRDGKVSVYPRRDGLLVQAGAEGDFGNDAENLDAAESIEAVQRLAELVRAMRTETVA
ncbi:MAG: FAD-dependent oxidoreductase [Pseudomonadales bacterium]|nr:FAD-dependent oxidoreductase [Pseudomonadales bacterium]